MRATRNTSVQPKLEPTDPPPMPQQTRYSLRKTAARKEAILGTTKTASPVQKARKQKQAAAKTKSKAKERQATVKVKVTPKQKPSKKSKAPTKRESTTPTSTWRFLASPKSVASFSLSVGPIVDGATSISAVMREKGNVAAPSVSQPPSPIVDKAPTAIPDVDQRAGPSTAPVASPVTPPRPATPSTGTASPFLELATVRGPTISYRKSASPRTRSPTPDYPSSKQRVYTVILLGNLNLSAALADNLTTMTQQTIINDILWKVKEEKKKPESAQREMYGLTKEEFERFEDFVAGGVGRTKAERGIVEEDVIEEVAEEATVSRAASITPEVEEAPEQVSRAATAEPEVEQEAPEEVVVSRAASMTPEIQKGLEEQVVQDGEVEEAEDEATALEEDAETVTTGDAGNDAPVRETTLKPATDDDDSDTRTEVAVTAVQADEIFGVSDGESSDPEQEIQIIEQNDHDGEPEEIGDEEEQPEPALVPAQVPEEETTVSASPKHVSPQVHAHDDTADKATTTTNTVETATQAAESPAVSCGEQREEGPQTPKRSRPIFTAQDLATYERLKRLNPHGTAAEEYLKEKLNRPSWLGTGDTPPDPNRKFDEAFFRRRDLKWKTLYGLWRYYGRWEGVAGETSKEWWAKYREEVHDRALVYSNAAWKGRRRIVRIFGSDGRRRVRFVIPNVTRKRPLDVDGDEDEEEEGRRIRRRCEVNGDQPRGWFPVVRMENVLKWAAAAALVTLAIR
ncbi:hypothetical protein CC1G_02407 [Coprinopsis cinerea okayama7|uniref:Uncharacterized protein n=1 Tax=Coprinopsis cinerea (strain Okayama-7 / 130 / ATCC MYA-4618 / FGSC 9003) TaxID=240176 RepID=A8NBE7_COPC7|nr:hypothetical protein CC1G_02407 [Coprinopsis cinerea okayama7\|eukprot:XP_001832145.1 hypothetical protein CC1G_02407 [Coprinopsis cinerea okayama7\